MRSAYEPLISQVTPEPRLFALAVVGARRAGERMLTMPEVGQPRATAMATMICGEACLDRE
jgi:hypothetical protein